MRGGRPPRERRVIGSIAVSRGVFAHEAARVLIVVELLTFKVRKAAEVMTR